MNGFLGIFKPPGMTSFDVIRFLRRYSPTSRMGHTGTIDRLGAGVLVIAVGRATRLISLLEGTKEYVTEVTLGVTTDTGDLEGRILATRVHDVPPVDASRLDAVIARYRGEILQKPPPASAKKIGGRRASDLYRSGVVVDLKPHPVRIHDLRVLRISPGPPQTVLLQISCSTGTYVRSLAQSIGEDLGTGAHISFLVRTYSYPFSLHDCVTLQEVAAAGELRPFLRGADVALQHLPEVRLILPDARRFVRGSPVRIFPSVYSPLWRVYDPEGRFLGVGTQLGPTLSPHKIISGGDREPH